MNILIADDHSIVRRGLALLTRKALGEDCVIDFAESGDEVLELLQQKSYTMLLSDLMMPDQKGTALIWQALNVQPGLRVVIVSVAPERDFAPQCLYNGACAYINKNVSDEAFTKVIRSVIYDSSDYHAYKKKETYKEQNIKDGDIKSFSLLSQRENEIVLLLLQGLGIVAIAKILLISPSAAGTLKGRAFTKLNVQSVIELSRLAHYQGLHPAGAISR
ncbi:response regulator transcription factor [Taibaiella koreensis]|uniref:response regulator transcription factor n=1 Tax=Taibaiella koreensis TaxID=1268548 RepID=UPI000E59C85F|nr:response regulator transcription factor [Taibaiella koreensis]